MTTEHFDYGVTRYWVDDGQIAVIATEGHMNTPAINTWAEVLVDTVRNAPATHPLAICQDLTGPYQGFNAEIRERLSDLYQHLPVDHPVYSAIVLDNSTMRNIVQLYLRRRKLDRPTMNEKTFADTETALNWLRQQTQQHGAGV